LNIYQGYIEDFDANNYRVMELRGSSKVAKRFAGC